MRSVVRAGWGVGALCGVAACREPEVAPRDLDAVLGDMYQHYDDPVKLGFDIIALEDWLLTDGKTEAAVEGYRLTDLTEAQVAAIDRPDNRDLALCVGGAAGGISAFPPVDHAVSVFEADQIWSDPHSYSQFDRSIVAGDLETFRTQVGRVNTSNDIIKDGPFGVEIPYILLKDYQWVTASQDRQVMVARSWIEERGCSDSGDNCLEGSYSLEVYYPDPADAQATVRLTATWLDLVTVADSILSEDARLQLLFDGVADIYEATDAHLAGTD
jgi:hypothetical protein